MLLRLRKTTFAIPNLSAPAPQDHAPTVVVKSSWFNRNQDTVESIPKLGCFHFLHYLKKNFVTVFMFEDFNYLPSRESSKAVVYLFIFPITRNALEDNVAAVFTHCIEGKLRKNPFRDACTFFKVKQLIAKLDNIVAKTVYDESINTKGHLRDQLSANLFNCGFITLILTLKFPKPPHHVLNNAHGIFVKRKCQ